MQKLILLASLIENRNHGFLADQLEAVAAALATCCLIEYQCRVVDEWNHLHWGYGNIAEYPITGVWAESRVEIS